MERDAWLHTTLGEVTTWSSGGTPSKSNPLFWNGSIPWISAKSLINGWIDSSDLAITDEGLVTGSNLAPVQSILILVRGSGLFNHRYIGIVKKPVAFNQDIKCLQAKANLLSLFLYYLLHGYDNEIVGMLESTGIGAGKFDTKRLQEMKVVLPPLPEQRAIAATLSCLDDKIELNNKINANLEAQAQAIFKNWFVDFEPFQDGEFVDSELGKIPKGFRVLTLDECCSLITRGISPTYTNDSTEWVINQKCIRDGKINLVLARQHAPKNVNEKWLRFGDILINSTGTGTLGRVAQAYFEPSHLVADSHITIVRAKRDIIIQYLGACMLGMQTLFESMASGSTGQTELSREQLCQIKVKLPDQASLAAFNTIYDPIMTMITIIQEENNKLSAIRDALLPKLMSGEIEVPVNDREN